MIAYWASMKSVKGRSPKLSSEPTIAVDMKELDREMGPTIKLATCDIGWFPSLLRPVWMGERRVISGKMKKRKSKEGYNKKKLYLKRGELLKIKEIMKITYNDKRKHR